MTFAPDIVIAPSSGWPSFRLRELWAYRELFFFLTWRDIKVRYKQTLLGVAWAVLVPLMTMVVFNLLLGLLMGRGNKPTIPGVPYAIAAYCALVPWQLFRSRCLVRSSCIHTANSPPRHYEVGNSHRFAIVHMPSVMGTRDDTTSHKTSHTQHYPVPPSNTFGTPGNVAVAVIALVTEIEGECP